MRAKTCLDAGHECAMTGSDGIEHVVSAIARHQTQGASLALALRVTGGAASVVSVGRLRGSSARRVISKHLITQGYDILRCVTLRSDDGTGVACREGEHAGDEQDEQSGEGGGACYGTCHDGSCFWKSRGK